MTADLEGLGELVRSAPGLVGKRNLELIGELGIGIDGDDAALLPHGDGFLVLCGEAIAPSFVFAAYFTSADYATKNADVMARFRKGIAESTAYVNAHWTEMFPLLSKYTGLEPSTLAAAKRDVLGTALDASLIQPLIDAAVKYKVIPTRFLATDMVDAAARP